MMYSAAMAPYLRPRGLAAHFVIDESAAAARSRGSEAFRMLSQVACQFTLRAKSTSMPGIQNSIIVTESGMLHRLRRIARVRPKLIPSASLTSPQPCARKRSGRAAVTLRELRRALPGARRDRRARLGRDARRGQ